MVTRRQWGEGTYYEKDNRFYYQFPRQAGTTYRPTVSGKTKKIRDERRKAKEAQLAANILSPDMTLNQFLDKYMRDIDADIAKGRGKIRATTYHRNVASLAPIRKLIGEMKLDGLRLRHIEQAYRDMGDTYAASSVQRSHAILHGALNKALAWEMLAKNPSTGAEIAKDAKQEMEYLTLEEVQRLLSIPDRLHALWHLLIFTGLRNGEARALRWEDYDPIRRELKVSGTLVDGYDGTLKRNPPKSAAGNRIVPIDPDLAESLALHRTAQKREKMAAGAMWADNPYIFTNNAGMPYWSLQYYWERLIPKVTKKHVTLHSTRHTCAYIHINHLGTTDYELSKLLGHSSPSITYANYGHFRQERATETAGKMGNLLRGVG